MKPITKKQKEIIKKGLKTITEVVKPKTLKFKKRGKTINKLGDRPNRSTQYLINQFTSSANSEWMDDIITGIVRSYSVADSHKGFKFKPSTVKRILSELECVTVYDIQEVTHLGKSQAANYFNMVKLVLTFADYQKATKARSVLDTNQTDNSKYEAVQVIPLSLKSNGQINPDLFPNAAKKQQTSSVLAANEDDFELESLFGAGRDVA